MSPRGVTVVTVRAVVDGLPATSEKAFSSGAPRFFVADRPFAHLKPDLRTLVVRVADDDWEMLLHAAAAALRPQPPVSPRQRAHFAALDLAAASREVVTDALIDAWLACAPRALVDDWRSNATKTAES